MVENWNLETRYSKNDEVNTLTSETHRFDDRMEQSNIRTSLAFIRTIDAEKRTHLAELRTGIGIMTIALSLMTILIATSSSYSVSQVLGYLTVLGVGIVFLFLIGGHLVFSSLRRLRRDAVLRSKCEDLSCLVSEFNHHDHE
jgi:uncharacterized membrane protein YidH (DUF202 family)